MEEMRTVGIYAMSGRGKRDAGSALAARKLPWVHRAWLPTLALVLFLAPRSDSAEIDGPLLLPLPTLTSDTSLASDTTPPASASPVHSSDAPPSVSPGTIEIRVQGPDSMRVHERGRFAITVINGTPVPSGRLRLEVTIPEHLVPVDRTPVQGCLNWPIKPLAPGEKFVAQFEADAKAALPIRLQAVAHLELIAEHLTQVTQPQLKLQFQCPTDVTMGECFDCVLTVTNPGSGRLTRGGLELHPGEGLQVDNAPSAPEGPYNLDPGESLQIPLKVTAIAPSDQCLRARAEADGGLHAEAEHTFKVHRAKLKVTMDGPEKKLVGSVAKYTVTVVNVGDAPSKDCVAFVEFPEELSFTDAAEKGVYDPEQHLVYWNLGVLTPGQQRRVSLTACPKAAGLLECRASAKDRLGADGESYFTTEAKGQATVSLQMLPESDIAKTGQKLRYGFKLFNRGSLPATKIVLSVKADEGLEVVAAQSKGWVAANGAWEFTVEQLKPEQEANALLVFEAKTAGGKTVSATVSSPDLAGKVTASEAIRIFDLE